MGLWTKIKEWILGVELISTKELNDICSIIIDDIDTNHNGMISIEEFIGMIKKWKTTKR